MKFNFKQWLKDFFTVPCEGERKEMERGTFRIAGGSLYSYVRYNNGYSETIEVFDRKNDYLGSFEAYYEAVSYCQRVYGSPVKSENREAYLPARSTVKRPASAIGGSEAAHQSAKVVVPVRRMENGLRSITSSERNMAPGTHGEPARNW